MAKLDVYLRSIERFAAAGAILNSGQAVILRFPTGDRHATQVTPHDQLVGLVREVAPPAALDQIDAHRPASFEHESNGTRYAVSVAPRPGAWQVTIDAPVAQAPAARFSESARSAAAPAAPAPARPAATPVAPEMTIERGQYDVAAGEQRVTASGSALLDEVTRTARTARATDVYLAADAQPIYRVNGELVAASAPAIARDVLSRELGIVAPQDARAAWSERGAAVFAYGDGVGRIRTILARDHRGQSAALRLLPDEPPRAERMQIDDWLQRSGLVLVAGPSGSGKTVTLASIVRALGERRRRVIAIEDPIELVHPGPWISQREVGPHVASVATGVATAMLEAADAIVIGSVTSGDSASALVDAVAGGYFVATTITAPNAAAAVERLIDRLASERRDVARGIVNGALLATIVPVVARSGRTFEVTRPRL